MRIAKRLIRGVALPVLALGLIISPSSAADVLQCVPYARELSGIRIHGDAWTWWSQAKGNYRRGYEPKPGAVISLANSSVMPLGHVAVVSRIVDDRHILLRHANWSAPGLIEQDVLAIDASAENDWSQVRIWWGQGHQMGARLNPVNGFIYPRKINEEAILEPGEIAREDQPAPIQTAPRHFTRPTLASVDASGETSGEARPGRPRLQLDPALFRMARDSTVSTGRPERTLAMILRDVRREARLR
ncbi:MAG TPA: CHAP domain-containing protein [Sphingobium sp.]